MVLELKECVMRCLVAPAVAACTLAVKGPTELAAMDKLTHIMAPVGAAWLSSVLGPVELVKKAILVHTEAPVAVVSLAIPATMVRKAMERFQPSGAGKLFVHIVLFLATRWRWRLRCPKHQVAMTIPHCEDRSFIAWMMMTTMNIMECMIKATRKLLNAAGRT